MNRKLWLERGDAMLLQLLAGASREHSAHEHSAHAMRRAIWCIVCGGALYGACMGTYGLDGGRWPQIVWSAIKLPLLLCLSGALSLPIFTVLYALAGLRDDFALVLRALLRTQAVLAIVLASFAPLVVLIYASLGTQARSYDWALGFNVLMFAIAGGVAQTVLRAGCRELWQRDARHRQLLNGWMWLVGFIAVQMAWVLRPFVGEPHSAMTFFRPDALSNAYIALWNWIF